MTTVTTAKQATGATTMAASEARAALPRILDLVEAGEEVTITRHGKPVAVVRRPNAARTARTAALWAATDDLARRLEAAKGQPLILSGGDAASADAHVTEVRAGRDRDRWDDL